MASIFSTNAPRIRRLRLAAGFIARHSAIVALVVFAIAGVSVFDDYGFGVDEYAQRLNGIASLDYILGDENALPERHPDKYFGVAFEVPLIAVERLLRLEDSRDIFLSRHLLTHLFFLVGGFFAWLLAYRLFGSRLVALLAMLIFLLHPRIYAHSFFNSKDVPFLSMFMISLYLTHRAFRRDTVWAFALCGVGVGLLANFRIMGVMLIPAVLGMLALNAFYGMKRGDGAVKHTVINTCTFFTTCAVALYAVWPALWRDPLGVTEALGLPFRHPGLRPTLFRGEVVQWPNIPWDYVPTWILITTPPVALALAALGIGYAARLCAADWRAALANSTARFGLLIAACLILPIAAVIALNSNVFNGWRHAYFLYAPICVLAAFGLRGLSALPKPRVRAAAFALAALGIAVVAVQTVRLHPFQNLYFSPLVDKSALADRWEMDYWNVSYKAALDATLKMQPTGRVAVSDPAWNLIRNSRLITETDRRRLSINPSFPSFRIILGDVGDSEYRLIWTRDVHGVPVISIADVRAESEAAFRAAYAAAKASERIASAGGFDIYRSGESLTYIKEPGGEEDAVGRLDLSIIPTLPGEDGAERDSRSFALRRWAGALDGKALIAVDLPSYPIRAIETSLRLDGEDEALWSVDVDFYADALSKPLSELAAVGGGFRMYADGETLTYVKENCDAEDTRGRFLLSVFPADPADLPQDARDAGREHESLNFYFDRYGATLDGGCVIIRRLPDYAISRIETGQWLPGEGELWKATAVDFYAEELSDPPSPLAASAGGFDMWLNGGALTYVKENCDEEDTRGRFFLSVFPEDPADLPQDARDAGREHESLNFDFDRYGAILDGGCVIIRRLPDYAISRIETGRWLPGEGEAWRATVDFYAAGLTEPPSPLAASAGGFDIWLDGETLTYVKRQCSEDDTRGKFFLSVFPADPTDLSQGARDAGREHESLNFAFDRYGTMTGGKCVIIRNLPDYAISRIETGQWLPGEGELWKAEIVVSD